VPVVSDLADVNVACMHREIAVTDVMLRNHTIPSKPIPRARLAQEEATAAAVAAQEDEDSDGTRKAKEGTRARTKARMGRKTGVTKTKLSNHHMLT
jgi:hypothetical protein